jgi:hypothetical protein
MQWAAREFVARVAQLLNSASEAQPEPQATVGVGGSAAAQPTPRQIDAQSGRRGALVGAAAVILLRCSAAQAGGTTARSRRRRWFPIPPKTGA